MSNYSSIKIYKNNDKNLIGNILTYDDGWTEGIIAEQNNKKFVFGIFHRTKIIQLYLINIDNPQKVQKFSAIKQFYLDRTYKGQMSEIEELDEKTIEECEILPISLERDPRDLDTEKDDFINMFEQWKKYILQGESKKVYEKYLIQRSKLSKNALDEYESMQNSR